MLLLLSRWLSTIKRYDAKISWLEDSVLGYTQVIFALTIQTARFTYNFQRGSVRCFNYVFPTIESPSGLFEGVTKVFIAHIFEANATNMLGILDMEFTRDLKERFLGP